MHPFRRAVEERDFDSLGELFAEDVVFRNAVTHKPYHGRQTMEMVLGAVATVFEDFHHQREFGNDTAAGTGRSFQQGRILTGQESTEPGAVPNHPTVRSS